MAPRLHRAPSDLTRYARVDHISPAPLAEITSLGGATFLTVDGRLVLAPTVRELISVLPAAGNHSFRGDRRYLRFREAVTDAYLPEAADGDESGLYDFAATLAAIRDRDVLYAPHSGMAADCLGAALDLGVQFGAESVGYQVARYGPLDTLYRAIWQEVDESEVDFLDCDIAMVRLIEWIEGLTK